MNDFINPRFTYAIVGASQDAMKYGFKIVVDLREAGFDVIPINPKAGVVAGLQAFSSLTAVNRRIDVAVFVVPPAVTEVVLRDVVALGIQKVWLQPGSASKEALRFCATHNISCMHDRCIMLSH